MDLESKYLAVTGLPEFLVDPNSVVDADPDITNRLTGGEKSTLFKAAQVCHFQKGEHLFHQGERHKGIHVIKSGRIRSLYRSADGREFTLGYWTPGHFVGAPQVLGGGENMWTSVAEQHSMTLFLKPEILVDLIHEMPNLALGLIDGLAYKAALYAKIAQVVGTAPIATRLALLLLSLAHYEKGQATEILMVSGNQTQERLAMMVGSTRQAVAKVLERFEKSGLIVRENNKIAISDVPTMEQIAE